MALIAGPITTVLHGDQTMKITKLILVCIVLVLISTPGKELGAYWPYWGPVYSRPAHRFSCPCCRWPRRRPIGVTSYGVVTIYNPNDQDITYAIRVRAGDPWYTVRVRARGSRYHWNRHPVSFQIRFDSSFEPGRQEEFYALDYNTVTWRKPRWNEGRKYELTISDGDVGIQLASEKTKEMYATYGVVTIVNSTNNSINYQIKYRKYQSWAGVTTAEAHSTYYHWVEMPADFKIKFDRSFSEGYQKKIIGLKYNKVKGRKPTADDGRDYRLKIEDKQIKLHKSKAKNHKLAMLTSKNVNLTGSGEGKTRKKTFGDATRAKGSFIVSYTPRIDGAVGTEDGSWKAEMIEDKSSPADSSHKTQIWKFKSKEFGVATATIQGNPSGASGTATGWYSAVPGNPDAEEFKITFGVQFAGRKVLLNNFAKAY